MNMLDVIELTEDFISKTDNKCFNCKSQFKTYEVKEDTIMFGCSKCEMKITLDYKRD